MNKVVSFELNQRIIITPLETSHYYLIIYSSLI